MKSTIVSSSSARKHLASLIALLTLAGCGSVSLPPPTPPPVEESAGAQAPDTLTSPEETEETEEVEPPANAASNSAALVLLAKSETLRTQGKLPEAIALVERAIRLEPRRGDLWVQLGRLNYGVGELKLAEQYAKRGIALAASENEVRQNGWLLLADISESRGDIDGAAQIRSRWLNSRG